MAALATAIVAALYLAHLAARVALAWRFLARHRPPQPAPEPAGDRAAALIVLQPILGGDPDLGALLAANLDSNPGVRFVWLVDEDDGLGRAAAGRLADGRVTVLVGPPPADGENPKLVKLERGLALAGDEDTVIVLDDDTLIDARELRLLTNALAGADLVTGLPVFTASRTFFERFVGAFVNGNALLTYLPAAALGAQRTLNGMIYATRAKTLRALGGFAAVATELTDDYAMAKLYRGAGLRILQVPAFVRVTMTIRGAAHCGRVMRRWLIFANRYLRENLDWKTLALVALPALLATAAPLTWMAGGRRWAAVGIWCCCLALKACINRWLLWRWAAVARRPSATLAAVLHEMLTDLLLPLLYASAFIRPNRIAWRSRRIDLRDGTIRYE
jgi:ceramide glucosyltransferase